MIGSVSRKAIIGAIMKKDLKEFTRDRLWVILSALSVVMFAVLFWLLPNTVNETIILGVHHTGLDRLMEAVAKEHREGLELKEFKSSEDLIKAVAGELKLEKEVLIGIDFLDDFPNKLLSKEKTTVQVYVDARAPKEISRAMSSFAREIACELIGNGLPITEPDEKTVVLGKDRSGNQIPLRNRMRPMLVFFLLMTESLALASLISGEVQSRTMTALLVTPARTGDLLTAKAGVGLILAVLMALVTLFLNGALGSQVLALILALCTSALMAVEIGLIYGMISKDTRTLFTLVKTLNWFLIAPVIFYIFPDWPQWIAKIFPGYWVINPIFEIAIKDRSLGDVASDLGVALCIIAVLILPITLLSRRMPARLAAA